MANLAVPSMPSPYMWCFQPKSDLSFYRENLLNEFTTDNEKGTPMSSKDRLGEARPGSLHLLLLKKFPTHRSVQGLLAVSKLAKDCGKSHETLYRAVRGKKSEGFPDGKLTVEVAVALLDLSKEMHPDDVLLPEHILPFMLPNYDEYLDTASLLD